MSATIDENPTTAPAAPRGHATFGGAVRSEWIKLRSLRSTAWCFAIIVVMTVGLSALLSVSIGSFEGTSPPDSASRQAGALQAVTIGVNFSVLVASVLGALVITGEWGTGMIRSTFTAFPTRTPAVLAKALVFGGVTFLVGLGSMLLAALLSSAILGGFDLAPDLADPGYWWPIVGAAGYLALVGLLAFALGALIRNSAGAIAAALGIVLVIPTVAGILAAVTQATWVLNASSFLPAAAGARMFAYAGENTVDGAPVADDVITLEPSQGALVLAAWVLALLIPALVTVRRRDV